MEVLYVVFDSRSIRSTPFAQLRIRFLLVAITFAACVPCGVGAIQSHSVTPDEAVAIDRAVRAFMQTFSHSVTQDGPVGLD